MIAPKHVHGGDWKDMLYLTNLRQKKVVFADSSADYKLQRCGCGKAEDQHPPEARKPLQPHTFLTLPGADDETTNESDAHEPAKGGGKKAQRPKWTIGKNTEAVPTDAYGTIVFE
ncbi:hypothetical protein OESDEN_15121, partial [Oesophagostomum dentatum]